MKKYLIRKDGIFELTGRVRKYEITIKYYDKWTGKTEKWPAAQLLMHFERLVYASTKEVEDAVKQSNAENNNKIRYASIMAGMDWTVEDFESEYSFKIIRLPDDKAALLYRELWLQERQ